MQYMAELQRLAMHCAFNDYLDEALYDHLVRGLKSEGIQRRLLTEDKLDLKRALELAQGMELAQKKAQVLKEGNETNFEVSSDSHPKVVAQLQEVSEEIDWVGRQPRPQGTSGTGRKYYQCGRIDHLAHNCVHKDTVCHICKKLGHLAKVCLNQFQGRGPVNKNHWVGQRTKGFAEDDLIKKK